MKNVLGLSLILTAICSAQGIAPGTDNANVVTQMSAEEISGRIREQLKSRGIRLEDVTRAAQELRGKTMSVPHTVTPKFSGTNDALSERDQTNVNRILNVFDRVYKVYSDFGFLDSAPALYYPADPIINASAQGGNVAIYLALAELFLDSDSELSYSVGHELGHIVQRRYNSLFWVPNNPEFDADVWGVLTSLIAGFDPYAGSGALAKLSMVTGDVGLGQQFEDQMASEAHKSFVSRIEVMYIALQGVCGATVDLQNACNAYRSTVHPHFPANAVL